MVVRNYNCTRTMSPIQNQLAELFCQLVICSIPWSRGNPWLHVLVLLVQREAKHGIFWIPPGITWDEGTAGPATHRMERRMLAAAAGTGRGEGSSDPIFSPGNMK